MKIRLFLSILLIFLVACNSSENNEYENSQPSEEKANRIDKKPVNEEQLTDNSNSGNDKQPESAEVSTTREIEVVATNLNVPWEIVKFDESIYVSERTGTITKVTGDTVTRKSVSFEKSLADRSEAGLLGFVFPESFSEDSKAIAYYSYVDNQGVFQRVVEIEEKEEEWIETEVLLDRIPGGNFHQGGRIEIGPDGKLYVTTGDATVPNLAQDKTSLAGKILRVNLDGSIPEDNPFDHSYVYSYGHRNPQGLAWDNENALFATEHGSQTYDEVNKIEPGKNYGWPVIRGDEQQEGMVTPIVHSGENTWAPSGMTFFNGAFYFASLRGESVRMFDPDAKVQEAVIEEFGRIRDVFATDEGIYFITNNTDGRGNPSEEDDKLLLWNGI